ncbi:Uncharacterised protein [Streptococcus agalactiae]|nr:Uncharacterised protein [Streptococcus agalactiae]
MKYQINNRNKQISQLSDEATIKEMRIANAKGFSELKRLYDTLQPSDDGQNQISQAVSKQLQERKVIKKLNYNRRREAEKSIQTSCDN